MTAVVTKQGTPSKPGEVVDISKAKVVPPHPARAKDEAVKAVTDKKAPKAKAPKAEVSAKASNRLTSVWPDSKGQDVQIKDQVKLADGTVIACIGRWSKHLKDGGLVPMITGTTKGGTRRNSPAADCSHVKK